MDYFFTEELKAKCSEINTGENNPEMVKKAADAYERILGFAELAWKEGLLALEDACGELDFNDGAQEIFFRMITMLVDGTDPKITEEAGRNMLAVCDMPSYMGLISLLYVRGSRMIQDGCRPFEVKLILQSMLPKCITAELERRECEGALPKALAEVEKEQEEIRRLCEEGAEPDEQDHTVVGETARALLLLNDMDVQRLLRDTDNHLAALAMKGLPGKARARFFDNMSSRLQVMVAEDMSLMGAVRMRDAQEACAGIMRLLLKLEGSGEIGEYDFSTLKLVLDLYDSAEKENRALQEKYRELKNLVDEIYR